MVLGGLDIATVTGAAIMRDGVITTETMSFKGPKKKFLDDVKKQALDANELGKVFDEFGRAILIWLKKNKPDEVAIEEPLKTNFSRKKAVIDTSSTWAGKAVRFEEQGGINLKTIFKLHGLEGIAVMRCAQVNIPVRFVNQATWRAAFLGNGRPKDAKGEAVKTCRRLGIEISSVDSAEAAGIVWYLDQLLNPYTHRRANDLFAEKPMTNAQKQIAEANRAFKQATAK